jgi:thioredoxin 1
MLFVAGGKVIHRQVGALPEPMLREVVTEFLAVTGSNGKNETESQAESQA